MLNPYLSKVCKNIKKLSKLDNLINQAINEIFLCLKKDNSIFLCGNGGSSGDASHIVAEVLVRFYPKINRKPLRIFKLGSEDSILSAIANDYNFKYIFSKELQAYARKNDLLICYSTSGNSKNILEAVKYAKKKGLKSICFLGNNGGSVKNISDLNLIVKNSDTSRIHEGHKVLSHYIFGMVEKKLLKIKKI